MSEHKPITLEEVFKQNRQSELDAAAKDASKHVDVSQAMLPFVLKSMAKNDPRYQRIIQAQINGEELDINKVLKGEIE